MEEDDNYSFSELVDFDEELEVADDNHGSTSSDKETTNEVISEDTINICDLARNIMDDNLDPHFPNLINDLSLYQIFIQCC
jgi:hypothetical protein